MFFLELGQKMFIFSLGKKWVKKPLNLSDNNKKERI
jgi:hypothetical protein